MVFVLSKNKKPLMPCTEKRARLLLERGKAVIHRIKPFVIRLKTRTDGDKQPIRLKLDPGAKTSGICLVREKEIINSSTGEVKSAVSVLHFAELQHKGGVKKNNDQRRNYRKRRRSANCPYREKRYDNRTKTKCHICGNNASIGHDTCKTHKGIPHNPDNPGKTWLPPTLLSRVDETMSWVNRYRRWSPIAAISFESVKFDIQKLLNPEISGIEYQQGELQGYEVREYLLEKWGRKCNYCKKDKIPLQIEHIIPKSRGGTNRVSNLTISCEKCNIKKGTMTAEEFGYPEIQKQAGVSFKMAAMVTATRYAIGNALKSTGLPVEFASGAVTKYNRIRLGLPKSHCVDALCVGYSTPEKAEDISGLNIPVLQIRAKGRGQYCRTLVDKFGFPRAYLPRQKMFFGFQTGDHINANVLAGKQVGKYTGTVAVRSSGYFAIKSVGGKELADGVSHKYCKIIQRFDGYSYG